MLYGAFIEIKARSVSYLAVQLCRSCRTRMILCKMLIDDKMLVERYRDCCVVMRMMKEEDVAEVIDEYTSQGSRKRRFTKALKD